MKKYLLFTAGIVSLSLGILGIFLPLLPTTCFLLFATYCFARSSPRLHDWLMNHPTLGPGIRLYLQRRAVTPKTKVVALSTLWASIILSMVFAKPLLVRIILVLIAVAVSAHLLWLKTYRKEEEEEEKEAVETSA